MSVFGAYARYYDLLYRDKDYRGEADHLDALIGKLAAPAHRATILELGCGTGAHAALLAAKGYRLTGVDMSPDMLARARARLAATSPPYPIELVDGDARTVRLDRTFDVVISVFHVMSYQPTNADLAAAFATARTHLAPGGLFLFDCWYGPAVLTDRPAVRVRRMEDEHTHVTRIAEPLLHAADNLVDVSYHVFLRDKATGETTELHETHRMRYLFSPEIAAALDHAGFEQVHAAEWMTGGPLGYGTWNACFGARAR